MTESPSSKDWILRFLCSIFILLFFLGYAQSTLMAEVNHLKSEKSPYLQQHAKNPDKLREEGKKLTQWLKNRRPIPLNQTLTDEVFVKFFRDFQRRFDSTKGGYSGHPKFPPAYALRLLLRIHRRSGNRTALAMVEKTLDEMARGGIYDHVGGGFHRYSTDDKWLIPHFEKMLYDQAALLSTYLEAFQVTGNREYEQVAREIANYVTRDMTAPEGGFYAAEDADSEGIEGKFYVWGQSELQKILGPDQFKEFKKAYSISENGNFERGLNILSLNTGSPGAERSPALRPALDKLFQARAKRVKPHRDDKVLTSWNGLFISALAKAGAVFDDPHYLDAGKKAANFLLTRNVDQQGRLLRRWAKGESKYAASLEDYAFFIDGLIELYQATSELKWIQSAKRLQKLQDTLFYDNLEKGYFTTQAGDRLLGQRRKEFEDNMTPSGNSVTTLNLLRLAAILFDPDYAKKAEEVFKAIPDAVRLYPSGFPQLLMGVDYLLDQSKEIVVVADSNDGALSKVKTSLFGAFLPNTVSVVNIGPTESVPFLKNKTSIQGKPTLYVCVNRVCKLPTTDLKKALELMGTFNKLELQ